MLLHYPGKLKILIFCRYSAAMEENANKVHFITSDFVIHPQMLIFSVFKIASFSPYWLQINCSMSLFFYLFTVVINLWHQTFITADVTAVFINNQHGIQWRGQDFDKKHINTLIHSYMRIGIKIGALYTICLQFLPCLLNICGKFEF